MNARPEHMTPQRDNTLVGRIRRNWKWMLPTALIGLGAVLWLAIGYFGVHTLFIDDKVDEAAPVFSSGAGASGLPSDAISDDLASSMNQAAIDDDMPAELPVAEAAPDMPAPEIVTVASGDFVDRSHPTSGQAVVLNDGTEQRFIRFEDFETDNGPDLNVYLTKADADADAGDFDRGGDFIDLGDLKGNIGPQNYEIPADIDLNEFDTVVIWCVRFGVAFGAADLAPSGAAA